MNRTSTLELAHTQQKTGNFPAAIRLYQQITPGDADYADAQFQLGLLALSARQPEHAVTYLRQSTRARPRQADAYVALADAHFMLGNVDLAFQMLNKGLQLNPLHIRGLYLRSTRLIEEGQAEQAVALLNTVLERLGDHPDRVYLLNQLGIALIAIKKHEDAFDTLEEALRLRPDFWEALGNLGMAQRLTERLSEAETSFRQLLQAEPNAIRRSNLAAVLLARGNYTEAISQLEQACAEAPDILDAFYNLALALSASGQFERAEATFKHILERWPQELRARLSKDADLESPTELNPLALTRQLFVNMWLKQLKRGNWESYQDILTQCVAMIEEDLAADRAPCMSPFSSLFIPIDAALQQRIARCHSHHVLERVQNLAIPPLEKHLPSQNKRIHIGYVSADLRTHPVGFLIKELFSCHDRSRFSIHSYDLKPQPEDPLHQHIRANIENYCDISELDTISAVQRIRHDHIDLLVDLTGYTAGGRSEIFAARSAHLQLAYLGFPGVMCAPWLDGMISTNVLIPKEHERPEHEPVLRLPNAWFTSGQFEVNQETPARNDEALPEGAFVYCCFQRTEKIDPLTFALWMRILERTPDSVLWMLAEDTDARARLCQAAESHGIDASRLVFARRVPANLHLARQKLADLFLDTLVYSGTTTLVMAIFSGLPVLTCPGATFVSRLGAGVIAASGIPMPVATSSAHYEELAVELAHDKDKLQKIRDQISAMHATSPLFDAQATTRDIEHIYLELIAHRTDTSA
jgi:predicted O-linked N-acetylglucosamine transferase (SPINDLY family)